MALPIITLYAGCQTTRNGYDLWRIWNRILPEEIREDVQLNLKVGVRKINQITDSKRKFYAANTAGFTTFTIGAAITALSAASVVGAPGMIVGIPLLTAGALSTGIMNNVWTNKFRPRNGDLGIERTQLNLESIAQEIGERREIKKLLKNYRKKHLPGKEIKRFGCSLLSSMPFGNKKGAKLLHEVNKSRIEASDGSGSDELDLLRRIQITKKILKEGGSGRDPLLKRILALEEISQSEEEELGLVSIFDKDQPLCEQIFGKCVELEIDTIVLQTFIKNAIIKSADEHDTSIENKEDYLGKLRNSGLFQINDEEITFNIKALEGNEVLEEEFRHALKEYLLFGLIKKLEYEQYGLNDFYWALNNQNKKQPNYKHSSHHEKDHHEQTPSSYHHAHSNFTHNMNPAPSLKTSRGDDESKTPEQEGFWNNGEKVKKPQEKKGDNNNSCQIGLKEKEESDQRQNQNTDSDGLELKIHSDDLEGKPSNQEAAKIVEDYKKNQTTSCPHKESSQKPFSKLEPTSSKQVQSHSERSHDVV